MTKTNNKGFSLVELIIVIAIMAVLVGILAPQFIQYVEKSRQSTDIKNVQEMVTSIQVYCADNIVADDATGDTITMNDEAAAAVAATDVAALALADAGLDTIYVVSSGEYAHTVITVTFADGVPSFTATSSGGTSGDQDEDFGF